MIVYHGQVKSITLDEIEGAYKIVIIHVGIQVIFYGAGRDYLEGLEVCLTVKN